jgi:hypothetical protein
MYTEITDNSTYIVCEAVDSEGRIEQTVDIDILDLTPL